MKKRSLITKLALSGVALAATAATLATSTYAWYTSNTTVTANNVSGAAADTGDSSIFVSTDAKNWSQSVDLTFDETNTAAVMDAANGSNFASAKLIPVQSVGGVLKSKDGKANAGTNDVLTFYLYFKTAKTSDDVNLYFNSIAVKNKDSKLTEVDNLLNGSSKDNVGVDTSKSSYAVDIVKALGMYTTTTTTEYSTIGNASGSVEEVKNKLDLQKNATAFDDINVKNADALAYYNAVMGGTVLTKGEDVDTLTEASFIVGDTHTKVAVLDKDGGVCAVRFDVFLNGWDEYCYDACKGQNFTITLGFTSNNKNN